MSPLFIVGPTATGKTDLSFYLAQQIQASFPVSGVDILVVDSKQVYVGQDIVTGKDIPKSFHKHTLTNSAIPFCFIDSHKNVRLFGVDLVKPNEEWSLAQFITYAQLVRDKSHAEGRVLIIVGGTPLYTLSLFALPQTRIVAPDPHLRMELASCSVADLQQRLQKLDARRFSSMNDSDKQNQRRLTRAIEIALAKKLQQQVLPTNHTSQPPELGLFAKQDVCWVGLTLPKDESERRITKRVSKRLMQGAVAEYTKLFTTYPDWQPEAKLALGYFDIEDSLRTNAPESSLCAQWSLHEVQYAKRQMTWWKREKQIRWFDATASSLHTDVFDFIKNWYNERTYETSTD